MTRLNTKNRGTSFLMRQSQLELPVTSFLPLPSLTIVDINYENRPVVPTKPTIVCLRIHSRLKINSSMICPYQYISLVYFRESFNDPFYCQSQDTQDQPSVNYVKHPYNGKEGRVT